MVEIAAPVAPDNYSKWGRIRFPHFSVAAAGAAGSSPIRGRAARLGPGQSIASTCIPHLKFKHFLLCNDNIGVICFCTGSQLSQELPFSLCL